MTLKHDDAGFLIGDPLDLGRAVSLLESIRSDVRAMRQAINGTSSSVPRVTSKVDRAPATPMRSSGSVNQKTETAAAVNRQVAAMARASQPAANPSVRDGRGRFVGKGGPGGGESSPRPGTSPSLYSDGLAKRIASAVTDGLSNSEDADPTVKAFKEVAEPMKRGYATLFGDRQEKQKTSWFRRILGELKGIRIEQTTYEKAAAKTLKAIENKPIGAVASGGGFLPNLLPKIPGIGSGAGGLLGGLGNGLRGAGKGLLRRIPLLGALLGGIGAAADIFGSESDGTKTRREKDQTAGKSVGGFAGSIGGMAAGAKLGALAGTVLGPAGTIIGGVVGGAAGLFFGDQAGQIIGEKVGGWTNDLREADIPGKIAGAWDSVVVGFGTVTESIGKVWNGFVDSAKAGWETVTNLFKAAFDGLKSIPIIGPAIQAAEAAARKAAEVAGAAAGSAKAKAVEVGSNVVEGAKQGAKFIAENTTVGRGATWLAEAGKGYNIIQRSDGSLEKREGARNWRNFNPGNIEYGDFAKKHGAIGSDGRFAVFPDYESGRKAKEGLIFEGKNYKDKSLVDAIARYAPPSENDTKAYQSAVMASVGGQNKKMSEYTPAERARIMDAMERQEGFKPGKVSMVSQALPVAAMVPQVATGSMPSIPSMPAAPMIPDAPEIREPLSSGDTGRGITVTMPPKDHGQDLSDRRLAHIVTGGYSSA